MADNQIAPDPDYTADGVPTFESVRNKVENRLGSAIGSAELASESAEGRRIDEQYEARQRAAAERLAEIRAAMHLTDQPKTTITAQPGEEPSNPTN
jgi:phage shock protein A